METTPAAPSRLADDAYDELRRRVDSGEIVEGQRLTEGALASELGMSRTPVREALEHLVLAGLLERARGGGYALRPVTPRETREVFELRELLEPQAAALAARHVGDQFSTDSSSSFELQVAAQCGNAVLASLIEALHERMRAGLLGADPDARREHDRVSAAIRSGDARHAEHVTRMHVQARRARTTQADRDDQR